MLNNTLFDTALSHDEVEGFQVEMHNYQLEFWKRINVLADTACTVDLTNLDRNLKKIKGGDHTAALNVSAWLVLFSPLDKTNHGLYINEELLARAIVNNAQSDFLWHTYLYRKPSRPAYDRLKPTEYGDQYFAHCAFYCLLTPEQDHSAYAQIIPH